MVRLLCSGLLMLVMCQPLHANDDFKVRTTMKFFTVHGFSKVQAAGIVGNLMQESKLNPAAVGRKCYGLAQWQGCRFRQLKEFTQIRNRPWHCLESQLEFILFEFRNGESKAMSRLSQAKTVQHAARIVGQFYLRPKKVEQIRLKYAQHAFNLSE